MTGNPPQEKWQVRMIRSSLAGLERLPELGLPDLSRLPWLNQPLRPAEIGNGLRDAMLARENHLEDVNYQKIVPNRFIVEVSEENYARHYQPIEGQILKQWQDHMLQELITANNRQGRKTFRFGGRLRLEVRPARELKNSEARILSRIEQESDSAQRGQVPHSPRVAPPAAARPHAAPPLRKGSHRPSRPTPGGQGAQGGPARAENPPAPQGGTAGGQAQRKPPATMPDPQARSQPSAPHGAGTGPSGAATGSVAYLEMVPNGQRWAIYPGINTLGRSESCQIYLDNHQVQEKRLVSGMHAFIRFEGGECYLFDGSPDGRPSSNGTYVNLRRVPPSGYRLQNGDAIVLAAVDPLFPRSDTPGVATFYFWTNRRD